MEADSFHRPPRRLAPAPPQRTVLEDPGCGRRQVCYHIKKIGEGGQGRCDVFERKADGKLFVYKLMKTPVDVDSRNKPVEAKILQDILGPHPRIIQMYNFGGGPQTVFYLEYCAAGDLAGVIENYHDKHGALIPEGFLCKYLRGCFDPFQGKVLHARRVLQPADLFNIVMLIRNLTRAHLPPTSRSPCLHA